MASTGWISITQRQNHITLVYKLSFEERKNSVKSLVLNVKHTNLEISFVCKE